MKLPLPRIESGILRSKVSKRIFLIFVLCALLPLFLFAIISLNQVRNQLQDTADRHSRQTSKATAMTVFERLSFLETDLGIIRSNLLNEPSEPLVVAAEGLHERLNQRIVSLVLAAPDNRIIDSIGSPSRLPVIDNEERGHLAEGNTLVSSRLLPDGRGDLFIVLDLNPGESSSMRLFGEIRSDYMWGGDGFLEPMTVLHVLDDNGLLLFSSLKGRAPVQELQNALSADNHSGRFEWGNDGDQYIAGYWKLFLGPTFMNSLVLVHSEKKDLVLQPLYGFTWTFVLVALLSIWIVLFFTLSHIRKIMNPIEQLKEATEKIKAKDFSVRVRIKSSDEFEELGTAFNEMTDSLQYYISIMNTINHIGISLTAESNDHRLMEMVMEGVKKVVGADGAALCLMTDDLKMELEMMHVTSLDLRLEQSNRQRGELFKLISDSYSVSTPEDYTHNIEDIYADTTIDFSGFKLLDKNTGYHSQSLLSVPMKNHEGEVIGVLQLVNALDRSSGKITSFPDDGQKLLESLASQAAVALTKNRLVREFRQLFEDLTALIGTAIDEKSPYTGNHCKRVPELTLMLADAVSKSSTGPFREVALSPDEEYELKIAALLHDCGKVTTPVHIVDKATKLEAIVDRIDLIRTRFEVFKRDRHVELLRQAQNLTSDASETLSKIDEEMKVFEKQLDEELAFLEKSNLGVEFMPDADQKRVLAIAYKYPWEASSGKRKPSLTQNEIYNLSIQKGTLTPKERDIINGHITSSIHMLKSLHYPPKLRNVPVHAGSHHEYYNGKGYPGGLTGTEISLQGRMLTIADVFEALTAADRPYKKRKKLSEALGILRIMKDEGQIDPDLYDLFISEKIYLRYARQFLDLDQIDLNEEAEIA